MYFVERKFSNKSSQKDTLNIYTKREWTVAKQPTHRDILFARYYFLVHKGISITILPKFIHWYTTWAEISWATIKSNNIKALEPQKCFRIIDDSTPDWNSIWVRTQQKNVDTPLVRINCTPFFSSIPLDYIAILAFWQIQILLYCSLVEWNRNIPESLSVWLHIYSSYSTICRSSAETNHPQCPIACRFRPDQEFRC